MILNEELKILSYLPSSSLSESIFSHFFVFFDLFLKLYAGLSVVLSMFFKNDSWSQCNDGFWANFFVLFVSWYICVFFKIQLNWYSNTLKSLLSEYTRLGNALYFPPYSEVFPYTRLKIMRKYFYTRLFIRSYLFNICSGCAQVILGQCSNWRLCYWKTTPYVLSWD